MSAEAIARVVADLRNGRIRPAIENVGTDDDATWLFGVAARNAAIEGPVVDATAIYHSLVARDEPVYMYEDHPSIAPPWHHAKVCYLNEHGNVIIMSFSAEDSREGADHSHRNPRNLPDPNALGETQPGPWKPAQPVDWDRVRWVIDTWIFLGGRSSQRGPIPTCGPMHMWRFAVYEDGEPADLHWVHLRPDYPMEHWDMAHLVLLGALNFLNCRNVDIVEPHRSRAEAKRVARTGVTVSEINVFPTGRSTRGTTGEPVGGTPLSSVRGHFAAYGPDYGRGLLFGKYAGRYWIPQHARGSADAGKREADYVLHPEDPS